MSVCERKTRLSRKFSCWGPGWIHQCRIILAAALSCPVEGQRCWRGFLWQHIQKSPSYVGLCCIPYSVNDLDYFEDQARLKMVFPICWIRSCTLQCGLEDLCFAMLFCNTVDSCPVCAPEICVCSLLYSIAFEAELLFWDRIWLITVIISQFFPPLPALVLPLLLCSHVESFLVVFSGLFHYYQYRCNPQVKPMWAWFEFHEVRNVF